MSRTTYLVCKTCKKYIWIGQNSFIYTGEPETMEALNEFLQKHTSYQQDDEHELLFMPEPFNGAYEDEEWEDVTDRK
jgi:hypothetical protein